MAQYSIIGVGFLEIICEFILQLSLDKFASLEILTTFYISAFNLHPPSHAES